jgi:DNA-binding PadR family transcriptional regulator
LKIQIEEMCDAFAITILKDGGEDLRYYFDQEDGKEELVEVFRQLGFETTYVEVY